MRTALLLCFWSFNRQDRRESFRYSSSLVKGAGFSIDSNQAR